MFFFTTLAIFSLNIINKNGFEDRAKDQNLLISKYDSRNINRSIYDKCHRKFNVKLSNFCKFGSFNQNDVFSIVS